MKSIDKYKAISLFLLMLINITAVQASIEIRSRRLTTADGLADNTIRHIYQDSKGFLWMSTLNGLSRYDGNSFINFYPQEDVPASLADHRIRNVTEDRHGFLWISTYADTFSCYDLKNDRYVDFTGCGAYTLRYRDIVLQGDEVWLWGSTNGCARITCKDGVFHADFFGTQNKTLPTDQVRMVRKGCQGEVYIVTHRGLFLWDKGRLTCLLSDVSLAYSLSYNGCTVFLSDSGEIYLHEGRHTFGKAGELPTKGQFMPTGILNVKSQCVIFTSGGSYVFDVLTREVTPARPAWNIPGGSVSTDNRGNYWVQNNTGQLYYIQAESGETMRLTLMSEKNAGLLYREQYHVLHDSRDIIWITTYGNGLFAYNPATGQLQQFAAHDSQHAHIASNSLLNVMEDRSGGIWISAEFCGISHLQVINEGALRIYPENAEDTGMNAIRMVKQLDNGDICMGTRSGGLYTYNADLSVRKEKNYNHISIYAIGEGPDGQKWFGTHGDGIYVDGRKYRNMPADAASLSNDIIFSILKDRKNRMWIGTFGGGLNLAVPGKKGYTFRRFRNDRYGQRWIRCLTEDANGWIWAGTSGGLFVFHPDTLLADSQRFYCYDKTDGALKSNEVRAIMYDSKGRIWISEAGTGFGVCTPGRGYGNLSFKHYSTANGLTNNIVQAFAEDSQGAVWISTEYGVSRFNPETETFENYFFADFILGNVYCDNCIVTLRDGRLAFGSNQGLVVIDPRKVEKKDNAAMITFTDLKLDGMSVHPGDPGSPLQSALAYTSEVQLEHFQNSFAVEFSTLDYTDSNLSKFSYRLENYEKTWSVPSSLNFAAYKNLSPGTYYLHVKACNASGVWGTHEAVLAITVHPPFYATAGAFLVYAVLLITVLYIIFRTLRHMDALRNKIKVEEQLTEYKLVFFTNISHEFRTPLTLIQGALEKMYRIHNLPREAARPLRSMDKSTRRLLRLINQLLEFRKMQHNKLALSLEETDVVAFLYEIYLSFNDIAEQKHMDFRFSSPVQSYTMYIDKEKVDKVAYNLLSNAFKYTPGGGTVLFSITIDEAGKTFCFQVADTGVGIPKEKRKDLFKRFMQSSFSGNSIGVGLHLSYELVQIHQGTLSYKENEGGGSVFTVGLPTDKAVYGEKDFLVSGNVLLKEANEGIPYQPEPAVEWPEAEPADAPLNRRRVLIIEDDDDIRQLLKEEVGVYFEVETAPDGAIGFEKARSADFDLIVCDVLMPGMTGFELTRKLKDDFVTSHIPIILLTALDSPEKQLEGIDAGADAYISKPFSTKYVLTRIFRLIEQRDKLREKFSKEPGIVHEAICSTSRDKEFTERMTTVLEENMTRSDFTIEEFASRMQLSRSVFYSKVRGITGYAPVEYLRIVRLKKAAELLLADPGVTVSEAAYRMGFNDPSYFSKSFKQQFGVAPSVYQKGEN